MAVDEYGRMYVHRSTRHTCRKCGKELDYREEIERRYCFHCYLYRNHPKWKQYLAPQKEVTNE